MKFLDNDKNIDYTYTRLSKVSLENLEDFIGIISSKEEIEALINEFETANVDAKGDIEREIVKRLDKSRNITMYEGEPGQTRCDPDGRNNAEIVHEAAEYYRSFAQYFPEQKMLGTKFLDEQFKVKMSEIVKNCRNSVDYITRLTRKRINKLSPEIFCDEDSTRLMIFKQFLKAAEFPGTTCMPRNLKNYICEITNLSDKPSEEEIRKAICSLTDNNDGTSTDIFSILEEARRNEWTPLVWADDIARGFFSDQRTTRVKLYWYAIIFEMTFCYIGNEENYIKETDIQENLFYNFYADNLLNNIMADGDQLNIVEKEPSGHGINIKNFQEVIYLYYIHKNGLTPKEKLRKSKNMIQYCKITDENILERQINTHGNKDTWVYESTLSKILRLEEDELCSYISKNYICGRHGTNSIRAHEENISAAEIYKSMIQKLKYLCTQMCEETELSNENIHRMMEVRYYLNNRCANCEKAEESKFFENCSKFGVDCKADYKEYVQDCEDEGKTPNNLSSYYLTKCATCKNAGENLLHTMCPVFRDKCSNFYLDYKEKQSRDEEKKDKKDIIDGLMKNATYNFIWKVADLSIEETCFEDDEVIRELLNRIAKKIKVTERKTSTDEIIDSTFKVTNYSIGITRTKLISMYYYIFMMQCKIEATSYGTFDEFYKDFCDNCNVNLKIGDNTTIFYGINNILEEAGYQEINPKNIFDITIIFLAIKKLIKLSLDRKWESDDNY